MKTKIIITFTLVGIISLPSLSQNKSIDYFGQTPPGDMPKVFAAGIVSSGEVNTCSFSSDGKGMIFTKWIQSTTPKLFYSQYENQVWSQPAEINFTGLIEMEAIFAPYGNRMYFAAGSMNGKWAPDDIWMVEKQTQGWITPEKVDGLNSTDYEFFATQTLDTTFFFQRSTDNTGNIYSSTYRNGSFSTPIKMAGPINSSARWSFHPCISPDGSYLIIELGDNTDNDLWVSFRNNNTWSELKNLGNKINTSQLEGKPTLSPDGKFLFFSRQSSSVSDIYWVSTKVIDSLKQTLSSVGEEKIGKPKDFNLFQNYPNPFNPSTTIRYSLAKSSFVKLNIYNLLGQHVRTLQNTFQTAGDHFLVWDSKDERNNPISSGIYFYRL